MALPLALTMGDPSGIGPDLIALLWHRRNTLALPPFFVIACPRALKDRAGQLGITATIERIDGPGDFDPENKALQVVPLANTVTAAAGKPDSANAPAILESIERAIGFLFASQAAGVVTNPIAKSVLYQAGFSFPGHTEYLAHLAERQTAKPVQPVMMIAGPELRTVPVTIHIPLAAVPKSLTVDLIVSTCRITDHDLKYRFGLEKPRLAVAGLNPHAGEDGAIGDEETTIVAPAIERLRAMGIDAFGPLPADTMFHADARRNYDTAICMYHDQALVPAKTLAFDDAVNVTLGLPFVRTSPDHGTAFDIAGSGKAKPNSLIAALRLAAALVRREPAGGDPK
jgi:4-hydroxythreonine-4-phosphate dehydrogenase